MQIIDSPSEWTYQHVVRPIDTSVVLRIRYNGKATGSAAAHVSVATTTGDLTFEQGASTAAAAVGTGDNPGTAGVIDISALSTIKDLYDEINLSGDWEAIPGDLPLDHDIEVSAGNAIYFGNLTDQDCTGDSGYALLVDTSLETAEEAHAGVTFAKGSHKVHPTDHGVLHEILQVIATATYAGGSETITVYACDDDAGTKEVIYGPVAAAATTATKTIPSGGNVDAPICTAKGKRIVVEMANDTGAHTATNIEVLARSKVIHPHIRTDNMHAYTQD